MSAVNVANSTEKDFVISRLIDASPKRLYSAWTYPDELAKWWGPRGYDSICEIDLKVGGKFRITMLSSNGGRYPMTGVFHELIEPERIVWSQNCDEHNAEWHANVNKHRTAGQAT